MKNLFFYISLPLILFSATYKTNAQGLTSSRYDADPLHLNPSLTGDFDGGWRVTLNYNELKTLSVPFKNYMISYDQPVNIKARKIGIGISALHDETGDNIFKKENIFLSGAYLSQFGSNYINFGIQAGYIQSGLKLGNEVWPDQYNRLVGYFEPFGGGEYLKKSISYFDFNLGINWKKIYAAHIPQIGIAVNHINMPDVSYVSGDIRLKPVIVFNGTDKWTTGRKIYLTPVFIFKTNLGENYMNFGTSCSYIFSKSLLEKSVFAGIDLKNSYSRFHAMSVYGGVKYNQWQTGLSYDYNISGTGVNLSVKGPLEIYFRYTGLSSRILNYSIPCPRF